MAGICIGGGVTKAGTFELIDSRAQLIEAELSIAERSRAELSLAKRSIAQQTFIQEGYYEQSNCQKKDQVKWLNSHYVRSILRTGVEKKLYFGKDGQTLILPSSNIIGFLSSQKGHSCLRLYVKSTEWTTRSNEIRGCVSVMPSK